MILTMMVMTMMVMTMLSSHTQGYLVGRTTTTTTTGSRALTRCPGSAAVDGSVQIHNE